MNDSTQSLKNKTLLSVLWNGIDKVGFQIIAMVVGIITARLLSPEDFGLIGIVSATNAICITLIDSLFTYALIRKENVNNSYYTSCFIFILAISSLLYIAIAATSNFASEFYRLQDLSIIFKVLPFSIILASVCVIPNAILTRNLKFGILSKANLTSAVIAGIVAVIMAKNGCGHWTLITQIMLQYGIKASILTYCARWKFAEIRFSYIKETVKFSFLITSSSLIANVVKNIYNIIIGKSYPASVLGYYTQSNKYQQIISTTLTNTITGVTYSMLAKLQNDKEKQLAYFRKTIKCTSFCVFPATIGMASVAEEFVTIILTTKWIEIVPMFKILLFAGLFAPFYSLYNQLLIINGLSSKQFLLELTKNALIIISIFFGLSSIKNLLMSYLIASLLSFVFNIYIIKKHCGYNVKDQFLDFTPYLLYSLPMMFSTDLYHILFSTGNVYAQAAFKIAAGILSYVILNLLFKDSVFLMMIDMIKKQFKK